MSVAIFIYSSGSVIVFKVVNQLKAQLWLPWRVLDAKIRHFVCYPNNSIENSNVSIFGQNTVRPQTLF